MNRGKRSLWTTIGDKRPHPFGIKTLVFFIDVGVFVIFTAFIRPFGKKAEHYGPYG